MVTYAAEITPVKSSVNFKGSKVERVKNTLFC
jgi:hypothetical protein